MAEEHPPLENLLTSLNRDQLQSLVLKLAQREPSLMDVIKKAKSKPMPPCLSA